MGWGNQKCSWVRLEKAIEMQVSGAARLPRMGPGERTQQQLEAPTFSVTLIGSEIR